MAAMPSGPSPKPALPFDPVEEARRLWGEHGWGSAADGMAAVTSLMRAQAIVLARVEAVLRPLGLTFARYEVLMLLLFSRRGSLPLGRIGERLQVHPASVTNAIDRLEATGLVRREPHPSDRRATLAMLTDPGRELATKATEALNGSVFAAPGLSSEQVGTLVDVLASMRRSAGDF
jgi:DNA-binding MarR family transcriptional regulator